jgi:hypothetical protein
MFALTSTIFQESFSWQSYSALIVKIRDLDWGLSYVKIEFEEHCRVCTQSEVEIPNTGNGT